MTERYDEALFTHKLVKSKPGPVTYADIDRAFRAVAWDVFVVANQEGVSDERKAADQMITQVIVPGLAAKLREEGWQVML